MMIVGSEAISILMSYKAVGSAFCLDQSVKVILASGKDFFRAVITSCGEMELVFDLIGDITISYS